MTRRSALAVAGRTRQQMWSMAIALASVIALAAAWAMTMAWSWEPLPTSAAEPDRWHAVPIQLGVIAMSVATGSILSTLLVERHLPPWPWRRRSDPAATSRLPWDLAFLMAWIFALEMTDSGLWADYSMGMSSILIPEPARFPMAFVAIVHTEIGAAIQLVVGVLGWVVGFALGMLVNVLRTDRRLPEPSPALSRTAPAE